ncbi:MAG: DUF2849 domain-containing protein [bacterium]|nr:DUF2849 domain-containing protein [bacterium]
MRRAVAVTTCPGGILHVATARLFEDEAEANRSLAAAEAREDAIVDPYLAEVVPGHRQGPKSTPMPTTLAKKPGDSRPRAANAA